MRDINVLSSTPQLCVCIVSFSTVFESITLTMCAVDKICHTSPCFAWDVVIEVVGLSYRRNLGLVNLYLQTTVGIRYAGLSILFRDRLPSSARGTPKRNKRFVHLW